MASQTHNRGFRPCRVCHRARRRQTPEPHAVGGIAAPLWKVNFSSVNGVWRMFPIRAYRAHTLLPNIGSIAVRQVFHGDERPSNYRKIQNYETLTSKRLSMSPLLFIMSKRKIAEGRRLSRKTVPEKVPSASTGYLPCAHH